MYIFAPKLVLRSVIIIRSICELVSFSFVLFWEKNQSN